MSKLPKLPPGTLASDFDPDFLAGVAAMEMAQRMQRRRYGKYAAFAMHTAGEAADRTREAPNTALGSLRSTDNGNEHE